MIKLQIIGNLGRDCVVNNVNGRTVINFTVAHTERYRDSAGNNQERTTWVDCSWWTDRTAIAQYLTKGKQIFAEGTPEVRSFTKNDGSTGVTLSMRVRELSLLGGRPEGGAPSYGNNTTSANTPSTQATPPSGNEDEGGADDLPF